MTAEEESSGPSAPVVDARKDRHPLRGAALTLFALNGLAVAQPLFGVLGDGATFFVAEGAERPQIILFTLLVLIVGPAVLLALVAAARLLSPAAGRGVLVAEVGLLVSVALAPPVARALGTGTVATALVWAVIAVAAAVAFARFEPLRTFTRVLAFAPLLFAASFLFFSPVGDLVLPASASGSASVADRDTNVVMLMFDELSDAALLRPDGTIDAERFPNFARLAGSSTRYPDTTTVTPWTHLSVPALLSGREPAFDDAPVVSSYPGNLFSLLAPTRDLHVSEVMTSLCAAEACDSDAGPAFSASRFVKDLGVVYLHNRLPREAADEWLPAIDNGWAGFGDNGGEGGDAAIDEDNWRDAARARREIAEDVRYDQFLATLHAPERPSLWFLHLLEPHMPFGHLPDGRTYETENRPLGLVDRSTGWGSEQDVNDQARVRYLLQLQDVDRRMGEVMDRLDQEGMAANTLLVVVSDHGVSFDADGHRRGVPATPDNENEVIPVPLFIRYPGQSAGAVDDRPVSLIDVFPTIADVLDAELPDEWQVDGESLLGPESGTPRRFAWGRGDESMEVGPEVRALRAVSEYADLVGPAGGPHDLYAWGPHRGLVGQPLDDLGLSSKPAVDGTVDELAPYDPASGVVPAMVTGQVTGSTDLRWVVVTVDGVAAGVGPIAVIQDSAFAVMVDPALLRAGRNEISAWLLDDSGRLVEISSSG